MSDVLGEPLERADRWQDRRAFADGLDLHTVGDLLDHIPRRYVERGELTSLKELVVGEMVTIQAEVVKVSGRADPASKLHKLDVIVSDGTRHADGHLLQPALAAKSSSRPARSPSSPARSRRSARSGSGS